MEQMRIAMPVASWDTRELQEDTSALEELLKGLADLLKGAFSGVGKAVQKELEQIRKATTGTGRAVARTVASFDQLNRLRGPSGSGSGVKIPSKVQAAIEACKDLGTVIQELTDQILPGGTESVVEYFTVMGDVVTNLENPMTLFRQALSNVFSGTSDLLGVNELLSLSFQLLTLPIMTVRQGLMGLLGELPELKYKWLAVADGAMEACHRLQEGWSGLTGWVSAHVTDPLGAKFDGLFEKLMAGTRLSAGAMEDAMSQAAQGSQNAWSAGWQQVLGAFSKDGSVFDGFQEGTITQFKAVVNGLIDGMNTLVVGPFNGLNTVLGTLSRLEILGLRPFGWLTWRAPVPQIPHLARGAVLPANKPFLAMVGDQRHGTNVEAPLTTIQEALDRTLEDRAGDLQAGLRALLEEGRAIRQAIETMDVGEDRIGRAALRYSQRVHVMKGGSPWI